MSWVYKNATVVIAAASIHNCHESFLEPHRNRRPESFVIKSAHPDQPVPVRCRMVPTTGLHEDYQSFYSSRDPLDFRGWPLQERLLSTRLLVFSGTEVQWSCQTSQKCEGGHQDSINHPFRALQSIDTRSKAYHFWHQQIMEYSKRRLSFAADKLPAISAVASHISGITGSRYIAGMWKDNLIQDMCWERHMFESLKWENTDEWRAPTFSWASVQGNVFYNDDSPAGKGTYLTEVLETGTTLGGTPVFGQVTDGFVIVRGPLIPAKLSTHPPYDGSSLFDYNNPGAMFPHGHPETLFLTHVGDWSIPFRGDTHMAPGAIVPGPDDSEEARSDTAYRVGEKDSVKLSNVEAWVMMVAYWYEYNNKYPDGQRWVTNMILGRSKRVPGAYERLGYKNQPWPPWEPISDGDMQRLDPHVNGKGEKMTFKIV